MAAGVWWNAERSRIIRTFDVPDAPTGESRRWVTADGSIWKIRMDMGRPVGTGERIAQQVGDTMREIRDR